jgi:hypothetical protein
MDFLEGHLWELPNVRCFWVVVHSHIPCQEAKHLETSS